MLMTLLCIIGVLFGLLFLWYIFLVILDHVTPFICAMAVLFKWLFSAFVALISYPFRSKKDSGSA